MGGEMEFLGSYAHEQAEMIKAAEAAADGAAKYLDEHTAYINGERNTLKSTLANSKATLTKTKDDLIKELAAAKDTYANATAGYGKLKSKAITLEADKTAMAGQVAAIAALDKKAAAALVEKRELWSTISTIQSDITTALARASYLEKEGFEVDPNHMGSLVKMHYKLHSYVTYKIKKGKK